MSLEKEQEKQLTILTLEPLGYGNPDSSISYDKKMKSGELQPKIDAVAQEYIKSGEGLVKVHEHDDGCIDGRCTLKVYVSTNELDSLSDDNAQLYITEGGEFYFKDSDSSNHERAKVAGGGYITGLAMRLGATGKHGKSIDEDLAKIGIDFADKGIVCGAHSGEHMHGDATDCGANDKFRLILENGIFFKEDLIKTTKAIMEMIGKDFNADFFNKVIENWQDVVGDDVYFGDSTGKSRLNTVLATQSALIETNREKNPPAVTKHLKGDHNEAYIALNFVEGKTFSQNALLKMLRKEFPGVADKDLPQSFVVDGWRVAELANAVVEDAQKELALYAGVMYQLATAATLTDGTLKNFAYTE